MKNKKIKDPVSAATHFIGFVVSIPIMICLIAKSVEEASMLHVAAFIVFGISLLLLYGASTLYHSLPVKKETEIKLKRIDHMMIFVLIAGTYTPVCLINLRGKVGWTLLAFVWAFAIAGIILKAVWIGAPRWLSTAIYVIMGWLVVFAFCPLERAVPVGGLALLAAGGIVYTLGAVIYAVKWPKLNFRAFGFHEIFHLFVMAGTAFHTAFMFAYVL